MSRGAHGAQPSSGEVHGGGAREPRRAVSSEAAAPPTADPGLPVAIDPPVAPLGGPGVPVPTLRSVWLLALGLVPAILVGVVPPLGPLLLAFDGALLLLLLLDFARAPRASELRVARGLPPRLSSGVRHEVHLEVTASRPLTGELRDAPPAEVHSEGARGSFRTGDLGRASLTYRLTSQTRGALRFGEVHVRLTGPLGLVQRQLRVPLGRTTECWPDLGALSREALGIARARPGDGRHLARRPSEGREFDSLREYRQGDDARTIDWKATARRAAPMVRIHRPEQHQPVLLLLDCGRQMAGLVDSRRKLDHAIDALLRLATVSLEAGDRVGLVAYGARVLVHLPPCGGTAHLRRLASSLVHLEASLEESNHAAALDTALARHHRRSLVVLFTDLRDGESVQPLVSRVLALRPRHLPLVVSLRDEPLHRRATGVPLDVQTSFERHAAQQLEHEVQRTLAALRERGALVVREPPERFGAGSVRAYLALKDRGLL